MTPESLGPASAGPGVSVVVGVGVWIKQEDKRFLITHRSETTGASDDVANDISLERFEYLFSNLPTIVSHVHLKFVIYHAGRTFSKWVYDFCIAREDLLDQIECIMSIYRLWTKPIPSNDTHSFIHIPKSLDPVNRNDAESSFTRAEQFNWRRQSKPHDAEARDEVLEYETLLAFTELAPDNTSKNESISQWLVGVPTSPGDFDVDCDQDWKKFVPNQIRQVDRSVVTMALYAIHWRVWRLKPEVVLV
ncbi:hypothetical protein CPB84DRAFT_1847202 [Gymnopilus junonius]|uniref:Uncharacterized protein n=1 Tax=Gymnopilus junonius TaxID=109634 RepID=A0A9P5TNX8_GYMJU|nr:hypothetical protein CPB84DRAFT_1847202 [Gymnopilus junonius]